MDAINQPLLAVRDLSVAFHQGGGSTLAVDKVSFQIRRGECVALVGESGSGKSVSALSILKLLPYPTASHPSGSIRFRGRELLELSEQEMRGIRGGDISIIFQEPMTSLNPLHTIEAQIGEIIQLHNPTSNALVRQRTLELLTQVGIPDPETRLKSYPHQLSGGQRQRVMIAMALANEPDLLIADEPTTALDVTIQAQIVEVMRTAQEETHAATILITHDLGLIAELADRVVVMYAGRVVELGDVFTIFNSPRHPYTIGLMNSLARVDADQERLEPIPGQPPSLITLPPGCAFHPRCAHSQGRARCRTDVPELRQVGEGVHLTACHFSEELASAQAGAGSVGGHR